MTYSHVATSITTTNNPPQGATQSVGLDNYYALVAIQDKVNRYKERGSVLFTIIMPRLSSKTR